MIVSLQDAGMNSIKYASPVITLPGQVAPQIKIKTYNHTISFAKSMPATATNMIMKLMFVIHFLPYLSA